MPINIKPCKVCGKLFQPRSSANTRCSYCKGVKLARGNPREKLLTYEDKCKAVRFLMIVDELVQFYPYLKPNIDLAELQRVWSVYDGKEVVVIG